MSKFEENPLYQAFINEDYNTIISLLETENAYELIINFDPEESALHYATDKGYIEVVKKIIKLGINPNIKNKIGHTPLHIATLRRHLNIITVLLNHPQINFDISDNIGNTPIHLAAYSGCIHSASKLLAKGVNVEVRNIHGWNPIHLSAFNGHTSVIIALLKKGVNIETPNNNGDTPLHLVAKYGYKDALIALLCKGANIQLINNEGYTPLHLAVKKGCKDTVIELLHMGANLEAINNEGYTPLHLAILYEHKDVTIELLNSGTNLEATDNEGNTPLFLATGTENRDIVVELLKRRANIEARDNLGNTLIHFAAANGYSDIVTILLNRNISTEVINNEGNTPLHFASANGYPDIVTKLLMKNASLEAINNEGSTPLHLAVNKHLFIVTLLVNSGANIDSCQQNGQTPLHIAAQKGYQDIIIELLNKGANLESSDNSEMTPLMYAVKSGHKKLVQELLNRKASIEAEDIEGNTPLKYALDNKHIDIIIELLNRGATLNDNHINNTNSHEVELLLKAAIFIDTLFNGRKIEFFDKGKVSLILPRLEFLIKTYGLPSHLLHSANIPYFIRSQVISMTNILETSESAIQETIEPHLAIILNKIYPEQFPSLLPYSQIIKYQNNPADILTCRYLLISYEQMPHFKPLKLFAYMLHPDNQHNLIKLFIKCYNEINLMFEAIDKLVLLTSEKVLFTRFKEAFNAYSYEQSFTHLNDIVDKSITTINNQVELVENIDEKVEKLEQIITNQTNIIKKLEEKIYSNTLKEQININLQKTVHTLEERINILEAKNPRLHEQIYFKRLLAKRSKIDEFCVETTNSITKRKRESNIDFIENERETRKVKYIEKGI